MEQLIEALKIVLANTHSMYVKTHGFHWNVVSNDFPQHHAFFDSLYNELWEAIDLIAEHIRACGGYAPASYSQFSSLTQIQEQTDIVDVETMYNSLNTDNLIVQASLKDAYRVAETVGEIGVSNFLQDRYDAHSKHGWMLRSTIRSNP